MRTSTYGKCHEEGGSAYAKAGSRLRSPPGSSRASTPKTRVCLLSALCSHLHLWLYAVSCEHFNITVMAGTEGLNPFGVKDQKVTYSPSLGKTRETLHTHREVPWEPKREDTMPNMWCRAPAPPEDSGLESILGKRCAYMSGKILGQGRYGQWSKIIGQR